MPTSLSDLVLLRRAINEYWPVSAAVRQAIVDELGEGLELNDARRIISIARTFLAMDLANLRLDADQRRVDRWIATHWRRLTGLDRMFWAVYAVNVYGNAPRLAKTAHTVDGRLWLPGCRRRGLAVAVAPGKDRDPRHGRVASDGPN